MKRTGPKVKVNIIFSCEGCQYHSIEKYICQSDWGFDHYCNEPSVTKKDLGSESGVTPIWCPFRDNILD